jgi:hypothetical protein
MYSLEEAAAEHNDHVAQEGENEHNEQRNHVIRKLPSFRPTMSRAISRQPSFFQKMFSSKKLNRVASLLDEDDDEDDEDEKKDDEEKADDQENQEHAAENDGDEGPEDKGPHSPDNGKLAVAPKKKPDHHTVHHHPGIDINDLLPEGPKSMPIIGKPILMDRLINRNKTAEMGMNSLMEMVNRDVAISLFDAGHVPVGPEHDRVSVTMDISNYMNKIHSQKQIDKKVKSNMNNIQKALNYRKSSVIIMNSNYSNETVRKIEPIYTQEARTIINFK